jgi:hypothetical protein
MNLYLLAAIAFAIAGTMSLFTKNKMLGLMLLCLAIAYAVISRL